MRQGDEGRSFARGARHRVAHAAIGKAGTRSTATRFPAVTEQALRLLDGWIMGRSATPPTRARSDW